MKRLQLMTVLALVAFLLVGSVPGRAAYAADNHANLQRAVASYDAMQQYFYAGDGSSLYREHYPAQSGDNPYSYLWPFSQAMTGTIDLSNVHGAAGASYTGAVQDRLVGLSHYFSAKGTSPTGICCMPGYDSYVDPPYGNGGDKFYDDNEWVGLASVQLYLQAGDAASLDRAETIFRLVVSGWDTNSSDPDPGGVFWTQASWSRDRNTVSNMPGAELGLRLYRITGNQYYLDWAKRMYDWTNTYLRDPSDGLYWDHVRIDGTIEKTKWSYNQGVPVGVNVLLYQITGDAAYLHQAESIANAALAYYGSDNRLNTQPDYFNAIFFKNLLLLQSVDHNQGYQNAMQAYADHVWDSVRDPSTGLFVFNPGQPVDLLEQAAMVEIFAVLSWNPSSYQLLY